MKSGLLVLALAMPLPGIIVYTDPDPPPPTDPPETPVTELAPTGEYANSGWQWQIVTTRAGGAFLHFGTMISPKHFITAAHLGDGTSGTVDRQIITQPMIFNGASDLTYTLRNGGNPVTIQWSDNGTIRSTDLRVFEIWETFPSYAELFAGSQSSGQSNEIIMTGSGDGRGGQVTLEGEPVGWFGSSGNRKFRWGRNTVDGVGLSGGGHGELLVCDFDGETGPDVDEDELLLECQGANKDSGGAWFIKEGPVWKLAAINFGVDTYTLPAPPSSQGGTHRAAIFAGAGLSSGQTGALISEGDFLERSHTYASRISQHVTAINTVIQSAKDVSVLPPEGRLASWATDYGVTVSTAPDDDPDGDGLTNLEEYLTESDPDDFSVRQSPLKVGMPSSNTRTFTLVETLDLVGRGITTVLQESSDLITWDPVTGTTEDSNVSDHVTGTRTIVLSTTVTSSDPVFYRLRISL